MKKKILRLAVTVAITLSISVAAREIRTPLTPRFGPIHYPYFYDSQDYRVNVQAWGNGFYRTAKEAFADCKSNTTTEPLSAILFGKANFSGKDIFPDSTIPSTPESNVLLNFVTLSPRFRYTERGATLGLSVDKTFVDNKLRVGVRAALPFSIIDSDRIEPCGGDGLSASGGSGDPFADVIVYKAEVIGAGSHPGGIPEQNIGLIDFAYRLDFLSQLDLGAIGLSEIPFVDYSNANFNGHITIANQDVTVHPTAPVFVVKRVDGTKPTGNFYKFETAVGGGSDLADNVATINGYADDTYWDFLVQGYPNLGNSLATQETLWVVPGVRVWADSAEHTPEAAVIQEMIDSVILSFEGFAETFFTQQGVCFASQRTAGVGDFRTEFFANYLTSASTYAEGIFGLTFPTGQKVANPKQLYKMPTGNNGHFEVKFGLEGGWKPLRCMHLKGDVSYFSVLKAKECVAAAFEGATVKNINPTVLADIWWGYFLGHFDVTFLNPKKYPLGCTIGYELYAKRKDKICFYGSTAKDFFGAEGALDSCVLANRTNVVAHKARFEFFCQTRACEFFAGWTHVFAGKNAPKETSWYFGVMIGF